MATKTKTITISAPKFRVITFHIEGTAPLLQNKFPAKAKRQMMEKMAAGPTAKTKKVREARDFDEDFLGAQHISSDGWNGVPAAAFRSAAIRACKAVGFNMTDAKISIFIEADGFDKDDGTPLVRLIADAPERSEMAVRVQRTTDIRVRPMWREWEMHLRVRYDADQFTDEDVLNLVSRAGMQVGIGEGRPFSSNSDGMGFGLFKVNSIIQ